MRAFSLGTLCCLSILTSLPGEAAAQNVTSVSVARTAGGAAETGPQISVPVAVGANLGGEDQKGLAPAIGFQLWQRDHFLIGAFFTIAATDSSVTERYGGFVLNPPLQGRSFYVSANYMVYGKAPAGGTPKAVMLGIGGRWGTTSSNFEFTPAGGTKTTTNGFGTVASITAQIVSSTREMENSRNEFQVGLELGPTWRLLGGDVSENDAFRTQLLGTSKSTFAGFETTFFLRVNTVQPFARFSYFSRPDGTVIPGFTGRQVVWGINVASNLFSAKASY